MARHSDAVTTLAVAFYIQSQFFHCFVIESQSIFTLVEAIRNTMWAHIATMRAIARTKFLVEVLVVLTSIVFFQLNNCVKSLV